MSLVIANNIASLNAQHSLHRNTMGLNRSLERLSTGLKVNRGADNPAALVISEKQRAQIAGLRKAIENTEKAISLVQTAEGALNEINTLLVKIRSLALDSANTGVNDDDALAANQAEIDNSIKTIDRIANNTQFGIKQLLDESAGVSGNADTSDIVFHKGSGETVAGIYDVEVTSPGRRASVVAGTEQTAGLAQAEEIAINDITISLSAGLEPDEVINRINEFTSQTGVIADSGTDGKLRLYTRSFGTKSSIKVASNRDAAGDSTGLGTSTLTATGQNVTGTIDGHQFSGNGDKATSQSGLANGVILTLAPDAANDVTQTVEGSVGRITIVDRSLQFQVGPNQNQASTISLASVRTNSLGLGVEGNEFGSLREIQATSKRTANATIAIVDAAIDDITALRGTLGAFQKNTLQSTSNNLRATLENTVNAESVIRDTDFAEEVASFTKQQVLVQAGTSVLSNANQASQLVLSLLNA